MAGFVRRSHCLIIATLSSAFASVPAAAKIVDLATMSEPGGPYEVSFCARPSPDANGFPGHAFVAFSKSEGAGRSFTALGLTVAQGTSPIAGALSYFRGVPGELREERFSHMRQTCLTVRVNRASYDRAFASTRPILERLGVVAPSGLLLETYRLTDNDCISYAEHVARLLAADGLSVPDRHATDRPVTFIERLVTANGG